MGKFFGGVEKPLFVPQRLLRFAQGLEELLAPGHLFLELEVCLVEVGGPLLHPVLELAVRTEQFLFGLFTLGDVLRDDKGADDFLGCVPEQGRPQLGPEGGAVEPRQLEFGRLACPALP